MSKANVSKKSASPKSPPASAAADVRRQLEGKHVCPFCGVMRADPAQPCPRCTLDDTAATRQATRQRIGPWFVLQARNPSAPGMKLATLQSLIRKGHVTPRSVVRGPTTDQMWSFAAGVRGLSREFGLCYHCGETVQTDATLCAHCGRNQGLPADADALLELPAPPVAATPVTPPVPPAPLPARTVAPTPARPPADLMSDAPAKVSDTGMDGGTSLDLQADALFPIVSQRPTSTAAPVTPRPSAVQRAPVPMKDEAILSARELAAAFQLDFKSPGTRTAGDRRHHPVRNLAALVMIAVLAGVIVFVLRPDWRSSSLAWANERWASVRQSLDQPAKPAAVPVSPTPPTASIDRPTPSAKPNAVATREIPKEQPPEPPVVRTPQTEPAAEPKPEPKPEPTPVVVPVVPTVPKAAEPQTVPAVVPEDLTLDQATQLASDLRNKAIDAEQRRDWQTALGLYEQIQKLPRDAWPADQTRRLDAARRRAEKN